MEEEDADASMQLLGIQCCEQQGEEIAETGGGRDEESDLMGFLALAYIYIYIYIYIQRDSLRW